jgi:hypothetical protein
MSGSSNAALTAEPPDAGTRSPSGPALRDGLVVLLAGLALATTTGVALRLTVGSLGWSLVHDGPLMHYVAQRILAGAVPYRDLFDMNFPGVYLVHLAALRLLGPGDAAFRAFDLGLLALACAGTAYALRPFGPWAGGTAAGLFWLYHVAGGAWRTGQRDLVICVPLSWMLASAVAFARSARPGALAAAGLALGVAVCIKPYAVLWSPLLVPLAWRARPRGRMLGILAVAMAAPAVPVLAWIAGSGALPAFGDILVHYLVPLYAHVGRVSPVDAVMSQYLGVRLLSGLAAWGAVGAVVLATGRSSPAGRVGGARAAGDPDPGRLPLLLLLAGVGGGVLHYWLQGKGWEYHLYPLALFLVALGAAGFGQAVRQRRLLAVLTLVALLSATTWVLARKGQGSLQPDWIAAKERRVLALVATLAPDVATGGTVQVFDTTEGGIHALYLLGAREPTRFIYDFHFYHDVEHPYIRRLRDELVTALATRPPAAVVLFEAGWPSGGYERLDAFPALRDWLARHYALAVSGDGYRVYRPIRQATGPERLAQVAGGGRAPLPPVGPD